MSHEYERILRNLGAEIWVDYCGPYGYLVAVFPTVKEWLEHEYGSELLAPLGEEAVSLLCECIIKFRRVAHIATDEEIRSYR